MAFKFNLDPVLKHRKRLEEIAQREFAEAQHAVDECLRVIEQMYQRLDEVRDDIARAQSAGTPDKLEEIRDMEVFLTGHKIRIERKRQEARELLMAAEEKQEALIHAAREKKVLIKLKEKRQQEYREWMNQMEIKELDDIVSVRQAWRKR